MSVIGNAEGAQSEAVLAMSKTQFKQMNLHMADPQNCFLSVPMLSVLGSPLLDFCNPCDIISVVPCHSHCLRFDF